MARLQLHGLVPSGTAFAEEAPAHDMLDCGGLTALISPLPHNFDLRDQQPEIVADWAMTHNAILTAYCADVAVVPMALGAVFSSQKAIRNGLQKDRHSHQMALDQLSNLREYTVQLNPVELPDQTHTNAARTGRDFLRSRRAARDQRNNLHAEQKACVAAIMERIRKVAYQFAPTGAARPDRHLDYVGLFANDQIPALRNIARNAHETALSLGLDLVIRGPWPPYSFDPAKSQMGNVIQ